MKQTLLLVLILLGSLGIALAHNATLSGTVFSSYNGQPMAGATVSLKGTDSVTTTNAAGYFEFKEIPARDYTLLVERKGYYTIERTVDLKPEQELKLSIYVYPELITLPEATTLVARNTQAASSEVISGADLLTRPRNTAQDMLRLVPGLFIAQHAGGGKAEQIFVRGFDCDHGTDVATFVDGLPVNMPSHGHGQGYADLHFLIPETVNKMEISKGPYKAQYGNFATGAAVQFKTYDSLERNLATVEFSNTPTNRAFSGTRVALMAGIPTGTSKLSSYVAAEYAYAPGYFKNNAQFHRYNLFGKVKAYLSSSTSLTFSASGFGASWNASGQVPDRAVNDGTISRFGSIDPTEGGTTQRQNFNLQLQHFHNNRQLNMQVFVSRYRFKLFSNFTFFARDSMNGDEIEQDDARTVVGFNTTYGIYNHLGKINTKTTVGIGYRTDIIDNALWFAAARKRLAPSQQARVFENSMNGWIKQDFEFTPWFHADVAARFDYFLFDVDDKLPTDTLHQNYSGINYQVLPGYKLNLVFTPVKNLQLFINSGIGYHSNDARGVVRNASTHLLPAAYGNELGAEVNIANRAVISLALWSLENTSELVYIGDEGTTEDNGSSRRYGMDVSTRIQILKWLVFDADFTIARSVFTSKVFGKRLATDYYVPLSPFITSTAGLTLRHKTGIRASLRYRYMHNRPANEDNSIVARGYCVVDAGIGYERSKYALNLTVENLLNTKWNEAQFATESRLRQEEAPVDELHYTPGTPVALKLAFSYFF
jgi:outer membrane receptor for Fe3+-dicitrate